MELWLIYTYAGWDIAQKIDGGWLGQHSGRHYADKDVIEWRDLPPTPKWQEKPYRPLVRAPARLVPVRSVTD